MTKKKETLRQKLRAEASLKLDELVKDMQKDADLIVRGTPLLGTDLMYLASSTRNETLRNNMITALANAAEQELLEIYNTQNKLDLGEEHAAEAS
jgi:hypothetical protein